jgi:sporulation protein YlmC with PRC-barrel domain
MKTPRLRAITACLAAATLALPAASQTVPQQPSAATERAQSSSAPHSGTRSFIGEQSPTTLRISEILQAEVIGQDHTRIGSVDDALLSREGRIQAVVIGAGGLLGLGQKQVAIPFDQILWNTGEVGRAETPKASPAPGDARVAAEAGTAAAERMPGAQISNQVLNAVPEGRSGVVDPATGPVTTGATNGAPATVPVASAGGATRAFVRLTQEDVRNAPEFAYGTR